METIIAAIIAGIAGIIATIAGVLATYFFNERKWRTKLGQEGIRNIPDLQIKNIFRIPEENDLREQRMQEILLGRTSSLRLLARSGFSYLHPQGPNWKYKNRQESEEGGIRWLLENDTPMIVILENPYCENGECRLRADDYSKPWRDLSWGRIQEIKDKYEHVEIYFTAVPILCSLFFTEHSVIYDPYHLGRLPKAETSKNHFLVFEFTRPKQTIRHSYYEQLECHFEFVLKDKLTLPFEKFYLQHREHFK